jgi:signal peptidase I
VSQRPALGCLFEIVETLVLTVLIFLGIQTFVAQPYRVEQTSMENTVMPDQYLLIDKLTPHWAAYERGDIIVFDPPESEPGGVPFIKRVIGLPGDRVELRDGLVYVNGKQLDEPYLYSVDGTPQSTEAEGDGTKSWTIPAGDLFVLGDHRQASSDSREFGPIEISHVIGRAWLRYWPVSTFGILQTPAYADIPAANQASPQPS